MLSWRSGSGWMMALVMIAASACDSAAPPAAPPKDAAGAVQVVIKGLTSNRPRAAWDALPASYQKDVTSLVHGIAEKMDEELYNKGFAVAGKAANVLRSKKKFILNHPMVAMMIAAKRTEAETNWESVVGLLDTMIKSELSKVSSLKTLDPAKFLDGTGATLMKQLSDLSKLAPEDQMAKIGQVKAELVSSEGDSAVVKITAPDQPAQTQKFTRVEGKWIPADMAAQWSKSIGQAKANVAKMTKEDMAKAKPQGMMMLAMVESLVGQLEKAETQDAFNQVVGQIMGMMGGGPRGGAPPGPSF
ncbi:MAG: hypothetical protein OER86_02445 [Phycisphaerae bacterium]|nr:hypothetical protein [Phycisphaerae bacterium]